VWEDGLTETYVFKKNGVVKYLTKGMKNKDFYWKVIDGKLYINPNNSFRVNKNKFILITEIKATAYSGPASLKYMKKVKYSISFEDKSGKLWFFAHNFKKSSLPYLKKINKWLRGDYN
jgi:hypothetical protein